jgi:hypothetical protein
MRRAAGLLTASLFLLAPGVAGAGQFPAPDTRLRITAPSAQLDRLVTTVVSSDAQTLTLSQPGRDPVTIRRDQVTKLEETAGDRGNSMIGALGGMALGAIVGFTAPSDSYAQPCSSMTFVNGELTECDRTGFVVGMSLGIGAAGALIGHLVKTERWREHSVDRLRVAISPAPSRGARLTLSVSF